MDTELELRIDRWVDAHLGCCGTCEHHHYGCKNEDSPFFGEPVEEECGCDEYMERKVFPLPSWKGGKHD